MFGNLGTPRYSDQKDTSRVSKPELAGVGMNQLEYISFGVRPYPEGRGPFAELETASADACPVACQSGRMKRPIYPRRRSGQPSWSKQRSVPFLKPESCTGASMAIHLPTRSCGNSPSEEAGASQSLYCLHTGRIMRQRFP